MFFLCDLILESISFQRRPNNPTIVVVGVNSTRVRIIWEFTPDAGETMQSVIFKKRKLREFLPTQIASRTSNSSFYHNTDFKDHKNYEARLNSELVIVNANGVNENVYILLLNYIQSNNVIYQNEYPVRVDVKGK